MPSPLTIVDVFTTTDYFLDAEQQWDAFGILPHKLTSLSDWSAPVVDHEKLERATPLQVCTAFKPLLTRSQRKFRSSVPAHAITILAVLSLMLGYVVNTSLRPSTPSYNRPSILPISTFSQPHETVAAKPATIVPLTSGSTINAIASASPRAFEIAVFQPMTATASKSSNASAAWPYSTPPTTNVSSGTVKRRNDSQGPTECSCGCGLVLAGKTPRDVMVRPVPATSALSIISQTVSGLSQISPIATQGQGTCKGKGKATAHDSVYSDVSLYAISTRIAGTISEYFDLRTVVAVANQDLQELLDALDKLVLAIGRQTALIVEQSKSAVSMLREEFKARNEHAKARAKEFREMGEKFLSSVGEKIKERTEVAKANAKAIKEGMANGQSFKEAAKKVVKGKSSRKSKGGKKGSEKKHKSSKGEGKKRLGRKSKKSRKVVVQV